MDTPDNAGISAAEGELFYNVDVHRRDFAAHLRWLADFEPTRFFAMAQEIAHGNPALASAILHEWGIWLKNGASSLSRDHFRSTPVLKRTDQERLEGYSATLEMLRQLRQTSASLVPYGVELSDGTRVDILWRR